MYDCGQDCSFISVVGDADLVDFRIGDEFRVDDFRIESSGEDVMQVHGATSHQGRKYQ